eukprot:Transcript_29198.p2 GENE.Transcript_29198~~Transcript_29198.p2  ORF type:complete len:355 (+),score=142.22 Transcript_29198:393-1457(+)
MVQVRASGYSEEDMLEEVQNMASGQSWVDFDDGRATEDLVTELPASVAASAPRAPPEPLSFRPGAPAPAPAAPPSVPPARKAAAAPTPVAPEEEDEEEPMVVGLVDEKPLAPAPHVGFAEGSEGATRTPSGRLLPRQKTGTQWLAEQVGKLGGAVGGAALSSRISQALDSGTVISAEEAKASEGASMSSGLGAGEASSGPRAADLERFVGVWKAAGVEGREEFLKAMQLPWILRKVAAALPQPDNVFFRDEGGTLRSHSTSLGKTTEEIYSEGGSSTKTFKGVTTTVTYHWEGAVLTYVAVKDGAPDEEASSRRWIEADGVTMRAESLFRKDKTQPWTKLKRTWRLDPKSTKRV